MQIDITQAGGEGAEQLIRGIRDGPAEGAARLAGQPGELQRGEDAGGVVHVSRAVEVRIVQPAQQVAEGHGVKDLVVVVYAHRGCPGAWRRHRGRTFGGAAESQVHARALPVVPPVVMPAPVGRTPCPADIPAFGETCLPGMPGHADSNADAVESVGRVIDVGDNLAFHVVARGQRAGGIYFHAIGPARHDVRIDIAHIERIPRRARVVAINEIHRTRHRDGTGVGILSDEDFRDVGLGEFRGGDFAEFGGVVAKVRACLSRQDSRATNECRGGGQVCEQFFHDGGG